MKTIFILGIILIFAIGCKQKTELTEQQIREQKTEDSLIKVKTNELNLLLNSNRIKDSIAESEQNKVIANIEFGITELETKKLIEEFIKSSEKTKYENSELKYPFIGDYEFSKYDVYGIYENDKLFMFNIGGKEIHYDDYETDLKSQLRFIKNVIISKYGEPTTDNGFPERYKIDKDYKFTVYSWDIGTKRINISIAEEGLYYTVGLLIYQPEILDIVTAKRKAEEKEKAEKVKNTF